MSRRFDPIESGFEAWLVGIPTTIANGPGCVRLSGRPLNSYADTGLYHCGGRLIASGNKYRDGSEAVSAQKLLGNRVGDAIRPGLFIRLWRNF